MSIAIFCLVGGFLLGVIATLGFAKWMEDDREDFSEPWYEEEKHEPTTTKR